MSKYSTNKKAKSAAAGIVAMFLVAGLAAGYVGLSLSKDSWNPADWVTNADEQTEVLYEGDMVVTNSGNNAKISVASAQIKAADYATYGVSEQSVTAYTIEAELQPAAALQSITHNVRFANPSSSWASGKNISDYIKTTQDGMQILVECLQPFGEQVVVDLTCAYDDSITTSVEFDFIAALESAEISGATSANGYCIKACSETVNYDLTYGVGTIKADVGFSDTTLTIKDSFKNMLTAQNNPYMKMFMTSEGLAYSATFNIDKLTYIIGDMYEGNYTEPCVSLYTSCITPVKFSPEGPHPDSGVTPTIQQIDTEIIELALRYAVENTSGNDFSVSYNVTYTYNDVVLASHPITFESYFSDCDLADYPDATGMTTNGGNVVFY